MKTRLVVAIIALSLAFVPCDVEAVAKSKGLLGENQVVGGKSIRGAKLGLKACADISILSRLLPSISGSQLGISSPVLFSSYY